MATEKMRLEYDSKERVALDLMNRVITYANDEPEPKDRAYIFKLYRQSYKAVNGLQLKDILEDEKPR
jgi:hypothetical protein